jgi:probable phosphoglycerate mutase
VVAHSGTNGVLLCHLLGLDPVPWEWDRFVTMHASVTRLQSMQLGDGHTFALTRLSDVEHMPHDHRTV